MALIQVIYDTTKDEFVFKDDESLNPAEAINFLINISRGGLAAPLIEYLHKNKGEEFMKELNKVTDDIAVQKTLSLKAMPFVHPLKAWDNVPKGSF